MSISCPHCAAVLNPKGLKPGKYQPKCPKCAKPFVLVVPADPTGTILVQSGTVAAPRPKPAPAPVADANATGDFTEPEAAPPKPAPPSKPVPKPAPREPAPDVTGDFTDAGSDARPPDATGDFTDADDAPQEPTPKKPAKKPKPAAAADDADVPAKLGGYEVLKVLGKGGMGAVLLGRQVSLDRKVALKVMHPRIAQNPRFVARFTREAYAAAQLTHHNVVQIYDIGEDGGQHFFSMEFVAGQSLMDVVKADGKVAPEVAVGYVLQAARGLRYGHLQGMVHRDIKPDNLMLNTEGIVKVADLGLVKLPTGDLPQQAGALPPADDDDADGQTELTRAGAVMGTPAYMPPEQARDSAGVDQRADVYSLGCTLYVLLTGKPPFEGKTALEVISKHQSAPIVPPEVVVKRVPKALSAILLRMMAKKPDDRYQSMDEVITALEGFSGVDRTGPVNASEEQADQLEKVAHQFNHRSKGKLKSALAGGFLALCVVGVVGAAFAGVPALAGGLVGLMLMAPAAYFVAHGVLSGGVVFPRARALVSGMRVFDWLLWAGGGLLFLVTLYLFGLLWAWLGFAVLAVLLGVLTWFLTDRAEARAREQPLEEARRLFKTMRLGGMEEDALRQFVCKFSGTNWEPFYEELFGYEAKLAARAYRKGNTGEVSKKAGTWREPVVGWIDARLEVRRQAAERRHLQKVEAKALEAEGVSRADASAQAEAIAADMVEQAGEATKARKEGKVSSIRAMVDAARERRRPKPGFTIAGKPHRSLWLKDFLNDWLGRRLRFAAGALVFAAGLLWMHQNGLLTKENNPLEHLVTLNFDAAGKGFAAAGAHPLKLPAVPAEWTAPINSFAVPVTGFLLMLSGIVYFGWKPSLTALPGAAVAVLGPALGVPELGPLSAATASLLIGVVLIVVASWFLRK